MHNKIGDIGDNFTGDTNLGTIITLQNTIITLQNTKVKDMLNTCPKVDGFKVEECAAFARWMQEGPILNVMDDLAWGYLLDKPC